jgi:hypothetical protein
MNWRPAICNWRLARRARHPLVIALLLFTAPLHAATAQPSSNDIPPLRPLHAEIPPTLWEKHGALAGLAGFTLLALGGLALWLATRPKPMAVVPPEVQARNELELLRDMPETGALLSQVSRAVRRYFGDAFALPPDELTTAEFSMAIAGEEGIGPELAAATGDFLRRCDERKFAPEPPAHPMGAAEAALELVERAESRREQLRRTAQAGDGTPR